VRSIVVGIGATLMKQTSGGSISHTLSACSVAVDEGVGCTYRILPIKDETQPVDLVLIDRVVVEDTNIHLPFPEVVCFDHLDAGR
jgi:hypothetical protein